MKSLNEDLKTGQFRQIYLLYGEEEYLKKQYKDRLRNAMISEGDTMNYSYFDGDNADPKAIIDLAETMPFFAERRLIVLENTGLLKGSSPELAEYMKEVPETTHFLFVEKEVDKRGKLFKAIKDHGRLVEMARQDERTLARWILSLAKKEGRLMSENTAFYLISKVGEDMENIQGELEKVFCYSMGQTEVTREQIDEVCTEQIGNHIFDMVDAVSVGEQKKALDYYYELIAQKEPPVRILYLIARQFRILMMIKEMEHMGVPPKEMAAKAAVPPFFVAKYRGMAKAFGRKELRNIVEQCVQTEENIKTGKMADYLALELLLVEVTGRKKPA